MNKKFTTLATSVFVALLVSAFAFTVVGCGDPEAGPAGSSGSLGAGGPIFLKGAVTQIELDAALGLGVDVYFVTATSASDLIINSGKTVKLVGSPALAVSGVLTVLGNLAGEGKVSATNLVIRASEGAAPAANMVGGQTYITATAPAEDGTIPAEASTATHVALSGNITIKDAATDAGDVKASATTGKTVVVVGNVTIPAGVSDTIGTAITATGNVSVGTATTTTITAGGDITLDATATGAIVAGGNVALNAAAAGAISAGGIVTVGTGKGAQAGLTSLNATTVAGEAITAAENLATLYVDTLNTDVGVDESLITVDVKGGTGTVKFTLGAATGFTTGSYFGVTADFSEAYAIKTADGASVTFSNVLIKDAAQAITGVGNDTITLLPGCSIKTGAVNALSAPESTPAVIGLVAGSTITPAVGGGTEKLTAGGAAVTITNGIIEVPFNIGVKPVAFAGTVAIKKTVTIAGGDGDSKLTINDGASIDFSGADAKIVLEGNAANNGGQFILGSTDAKSTIIAAEDTNSQASAITDATLTVAANKMTITLAASNTDSNEANGESVASGSGGTSAATITTGISADTIATTDLASATAVAADSATSPVPVAAGLGKNVTIEGTTVSVSTSGAYGA